MALHNQLGRAGEAAAARYLMRNGYHLLERNWQGLGSEVDIIASIGRHLVIVEVKSRTVGTPVPPGEAVDQQRINRLIQAGKNYLRMTQLPLSLRFDLIEAIYQPAEGVFEITHRVDYFTMQDYDSSRHLLQNI